MELPRAPLPIPKHLKKYIVEQNYDKYTSEDQAVWRYVMRQLKNFLSQNAHECYVEGLEKTGISVSEIPRIDVVDKKLREFGWGAIPVSGFIPPAAFMEFQSLGYLPIASDMRSVDHILYTPAPDIVHEAAGHAPILVDQAFADYLKKYAQVASKAIISSEDMALYEAIRDLSDIKEDPTSTPENVKKAEAHLNQVVSQMTYTSEAGLLSRMNWWTAEYGLIGPINDPKIFGAGLLSSIGESAECLKDHVKKIPLKLDCIDYSYDITEPQPQLFVTPDFETLSNVLDQLAEQMSFRRGGAFGLKRALEAKTVTTLELDSGLQVSGQLTEYLMDSHRHDESLAFVRFSGPCQISFNGRQLEGHGIEFHSQGFSSPLGPLKSFGKSLNEMSAREIGALNLIEGSKTVLEFSSGIIVKGTLDRLVVEEGQLVLFSFSNAHVTGFGKDLFLPEWGQFDMAVGGRAQSVFGGPADRDRFGELDDFKAARVPARKISDEKKRLYDFYEKIRKLRNSDEEIEKRILQTKNLIEIYSTELSYHWLAGIELLELCHRFNMGQTCVDKIDGHLQKQRLHQPTRKCIDDGISLAEKAL